MAKKINQDRCIKCGECLVECPNEGITETDGDYTVDSGLCTMCFGFYDESRCAAVCPVDAIEDDAEAVDEDILVGRAAELHPDRFPRD